MGGGSQVLNGFSIRTNRARESQLIPGVVGENQRPTSERGCQLLLRRTIRQLDRIHETET